MNIEVGEKLFEFKSKHDWINRAQHIWKQHRANAQDTVCIDQNGRICGFGLHFITAEHDNTYPIEVFWMRADMTPTAELCD